MTIKYCEIVNEETGLVNVALGTNEEFYLSIGMTKQDVEQSEVDSQWYLASKCPKKTKKQLQQEEKERVAQLSCSKKELALALEELGFEYFEQVQPIIEANKQLKLDWELCHEFKRNDELITKLFKQLSITTKNADNIFKYINNEITLEQLKA